MRRLLAGGLGLALGLYAAGAPAQEAGWRSVAPPTVRLGAPVAVTLGRPVPLGEAPAAAQPQVRPVSYAEPGAPATALGKPITSNPQVVTSFAPPPPDIFNCGPVAGNPIPPPGGAMGSGPYLFGQEWLGCSSCPERRLFESDHCFDGFISPVTNPFLFEDPRALTEVRPIVILQKTPNSNWLFQGGGVGYFGLQARLAVTERLSFVVNKLGWTWLDPDNGSGLVGKDTGWSELWLGPKFTLIRNDQSGTLLAAGAQFQIASGQSKVVQDTGRISFVPYLSFGQSFGRSSYGTFNFLNTTGYAIGDNPRTDYFFSSFHLDYDIASAHKLFPFIELNWFQYTKSGDSLPIDFEGRDLVNFGAQQINGVGSVTIAPGMRYQFNPHAQVGIAFEFPLTTRRDLVQFRTTIDLILRY